jgi:prepilin-type N-terminal cleavage/methylation domain-containing protein
MNKINTRGFTLLEMLLVIAIIAVLAGIVIVAINPGRQLAQARNAQRQSDLKSLNDAIKQYYIDNNQWPPVESFPGELTEVCDTNDQPVGECIDLEDFLVPTYLAALPIDPQAATGTDYFVALNGTTQQLELASQNSDEYELEPVVLGTTSDVVATVDVTNGVCGADDGAELSETPTNLCTDGTASSVSGTGDWSWTCDGINGGTSDSCSATVTCDATCQTVTALRDGLLGYWPLDDNSSTQADYSDNSNDGTVSGASYTASGAVNGAYEFGGGSSSGDEIVIPHDSSLVEMENTREMTMAFWTKPNNPTDLSSMISKGGNTQPDAFGGYELNFRSNSNYDMSFNGGNIDNPTNGYSYSQCLVRTAGTNGNILMNTDGQWIFVVLTLYPDAGTGGDMDVYYGPAGSDNLTTFTNSNEYDYNQFTCHDMDFNHPSNLIFGGPIPGSHSNRSWYKGSLDEVAIWDRVLSSSEIEDLYNAGNGLSLIQ